MLTLEWHEFELYTWEEVHVVWHHGQLAESTDVEAQIQRADSGTRVSEDFGVRGRSRNRSPVGTEGWLYIKSKNFRSSKEAIQSEKTGHQ